jgi:hypothetical protein
VGSIPIFSTKIFSMSSKPCTCRAGLFALAYSESMISRRQFSACTAIAFSPLAVAAAGDKAAWDMLREGHCAVLIRHTSAPGTFDPPEFKPGVCSTQRNLSEQGRQEARRLGAAFRANKVMIERVLSSPWCRCMDTATLAFGKERVESWAPIGSPTQISPEQRAQNTATVRADIAQIPRMQRAMPMNRIYVTHQFNIQDILGETVQQGEVVIVRARDAKADQPPAAAGRIMMT